MLKVGGAGGAVVLVSDGEDFGAPVNDVLEQLRTENIIVTTVGAGTEDGGIVPVGQQRNGGVALDSGEPSRLNTSFLASLAHRTGGTFVTLNDARDNPIAILGRPSQKRTSRGVAQLFSLAAVALAALLLMLEALSEVRLR
jgi:Ca-activated chloride channel homolog